MSLSHNCKILIGYLMRAKHDRPFHDGQIVFLRYLSIPSRPDNFLAIFPPGFLGHHPEPISEPLPPEITLPRNQAQNQYPNRQDPKLPLQAFAVFSPSHILSLVFFRLSHI
jgi:hypothetical protein